MNHENLTFKYRTEIYASHFLRGDIFPLWWAEDAFRTGTPGAFYYHKLFYYVAGFIALFMPSMKTVLILTITGFMAVGMIGMRLALKAAGITHAAVLTLVPAMLVLSDYAFNDWLIRGAMAEFSAMMIVPFVLWWALELVAKGRLSYWIIAILTALFFGHNAIALFSLPVCIIAALIHLYRSASSRTHTLRILPIVKKYAIICGALLLMFLPYVLVFVIYQNDYNIGSITSYGLTPANTFQPVQNYLYQDGFVWLQSYGRMNLQIGFVTVALAVMAFGCALMGERWPRRGVHPLILTCLIGYAFLLTRAAAPIYANLQPLQFIQFPWRLLSLVTPLVLLLSALFITQVMARRYKLGVAILFLALSATVVSSPFSQFLQGEIRAPYLSDQQLNDHFIGTSRTTHYLLEVGGEYLPVQVDRAGRPIESMAKVHFYQSPRGNSSSAPAGCAVAARPAVFEPPARSYVITCARSGEVILPLNYSRLHRGFLTSAGRPRQRLSLYRTPHDGRIHIRVPGGRSVVDVVFPSLAGVIFG